MNEIESSVEELSSNDDPQVIALELINQIQDLIFANLQRFLLMKFTWLNIKKIVTIT